MSRTAPSCPRAPAGPCTRNDDTAPVKPGPGQDKTGKPLERRFTQEAITAAIPGRGALRAGYGFGNDGKGRPGDPCSDLIRSGFPAGRGMGITRQTPVVEGRKAHNV
jgi:hypothetical protein